MDHPSQLLSRARQRRIPPARAASTDVPTPAPAAPQQIAPARPVSPAPAVPSAVRRGGSHALYSEVMKRHDRMGTRHL